MYGLEDSPDMQSTRGLEYGLEGILLREIVEALEGPIRFHQCLDHLRDRGRRGRCHVRQVVDQVQREVAGVLERTTRAGFLEVTS